MNDTPQRQSAPLTRERILALPPAPVGEREMDFPDPPWLVRLIEANVALRHQLEEIDSPRPCVVPSWRLHRGIHLFPRDRAALVAEDAPLDHHLLAARWAARQELREAGAFDLPARAFDRLEDRLAADHLRRALGIDGKGEIWGVDPQTGKRRRVGRKEAVPVDGLAQPGPTDAELARRRYDELMREALRVGDPEAVRAALAVDAHDGDKDAAAAALGVHRRTLDRRLAKLRQAVGETGLS